MKVILTEKITKLGNIGDTVEVKTGYARNYLFQMAKQCALHVKMLRCSKRKKQN